MMRRSGQTTRLADNCVQEFFMLGETTPYDHWYDGGRSSHVRVSDILANIVINRLQAEHGMKGNEHFSVKKNAQGYSVIKNLTYLRT